MPKPEPIEVTVKVNTEWQLTPDEVRARAESVKFGECITFPDGMVVDKRPVQTPWPTLPLGGSWNPGPPPQHQGGIMYCNGDPPQVSYT